MGDQARVVAGIQEVRVKTTPVFMDLPDQVLTFDEIGIRKPGDAATRIQFTLKLPAEIDDPDYVQAFDGNHHPSTGIFRDNLLQPDLTTIFLDLMGKHKGDCKCDPCLPGIFHQLFIPGFENTKRYILPREEEDIQGKKGQDYRIAFHARHDLNS